MKKEKEITLNKAYEIVILLFIYILIVTFIILIINKFKFTDNVKGFLLGGLVSLINFNNIISQAKKMNNTKLEKGFKNSAIFRYIFAGIILACSIYLKFNYYLTAFGLLSSKICIYTYMLIKRGDFK